MDCIFCKIINKEIPCHKVYEDDYFLSFLDAFPHAKGHTVIVPKNHKENLADFSIEDWNNLATALRLTAKKVNEVLKPEAMNIGVNDREAAGQAVPHVHWHILPRWKEDGGGSMHSIRGKEDSDVAEAAKLFE